MSHFSIIRRLLALVSLALILPTILPGQVNNYQSDSPPDPDRKPVTKAVPFSLEIRNGDIIDNGKPAGTATIGNLLDYLKKQGKTFNIILGPGAADLRISDLMLNMSEFNGQAVIEAIVASVGDEVESSTTPTFGIYQLALRENTSRETQVFNLTDYLNPDGKADDKTIEEKLSSLTDIIYKTLHDVHPQSTDAIQPHFQFHKGSNLLVAIGTPEALTITNQVVNALQLPDGNPRAQSLKNVAEHWADTDPAAAMAWAQSLPGVDSDSMKKYEEALRLFDSLLEAGTQNKSTSIEQLADLQRKISDLMKQLQDTKMQQNLQQAPRDLPDKKPATP